MKHILIHGLGQNGTSWDMLETELNIHSMNVEKPNLYSMIKDTKINYYTLYNSSTSGSSKTCFSPLFTM